MTSEFSTVYSSAAPAFRGIAVHAPADVEATARRFLYGNTSRTETVEVERTLLALVGRAKPIAEYGESDGRDFALSTMIPYDEDHDAAVEWWRAAVNARRTVLYRDGRGRLSYVSLGSIQVQDLAEGSSIVTIATEVDFDEAI